MARKPLTAAFQRTRKDHATETAEDYVEAISQVIESAGACRVTDLAERFGVSHVTVIRTLKRIEKEGFVETERHQPVRLTDQGRALARDCKDRHDVVFRFLRAIGVSERVAALDAEGIEHHVSEETLHAFRAVADERG